jgi:hypothetical protein
MLTYEEKLNRDSNWALYEGSLYFECRNQLHQTLRRFVKVLDNAEVDYALVGAVAMFFHGYRRFTESIDVVVTRSGLNRVYEICEFHGFVRSGSANNIRDVDTGVKVVFLVNGLVPPIFGLGRLEIPNPTDVSASSDGLSLATLETQITLKMNSGRASHRIKDLADAQSLIQYCGLDANFANRLDPSLRDQYQQLWTYAQQAAADDY